MSSNVLTRYIATLVLFAAVFVGVSYAARTHEARLSNMVQAGGAGRLAARAASSST